MSDSYDDYEAKIQLAEHAWEKRVGEMVKTEHDKQIEIAQAYERGWNAALAQREWVGLKDEQVEDEWERITGHSIFGGDRSEGRAMYISPDEVIEFSRYIEAKLKERNE